MKNTYKLGSSAFVYTPGIVAWAQAGSDQCHAKMSKIIADTYSLPLAIANDLVSGKIDHIVEGDTVVFEA